jgi:hypothetical protein
VVFYVYLCCIFIYLWLQYIYLLFAILPGTCSHLYCYVICAIPCLCTVVNVSILDLIDLLVLSTVSPCSTKGPVVSFFLCCLLEMLMCSLICCFVVVCVESKSFKIFCLVLVRFEHRNSVLKVIFKSRYYTSKAAAGSFPGCGFFSRPSYIR